MVAGDLLARGAPWGTAEAAPPAWNPLAADPVLDQLPKASAFARSGGARWDPLVVLGIPAGSLMEWPLAAYPPCHLYRAVTPWLAHGLFTLLHTWLAGLAMLAYLRWRGASAGGALAGACAYQLSTLATFWLENPLFHAGLAPWAPLVLWGAEALGRAPRPRAVLAPALAFGVACLAGHPQNLALVALAAGAVGLAAAPAGARGRVAGLLVAAGALGALLGGLRVVPMALEYMAGHRGAADAASTVRLGPRHLALLVFPDVLGHPVRGFNLLGTAGQRYANHQEVRLYLGLPALLLALLGVGRRPRTLAAAALALGAVALAFPPGAALLRLVPGFQTTAPTRALYLLHLFAPLLVAAGLDRARREPTRAVAAASALFGLAAAGAALFGRAGVAAWLLPPNVDPAHAAGLADRLALRTVTHVDVGDREAWLLSPTLGPLLLAAALLSATSLLRGGPRARRVGAAALVALLAGELLREGILYNPTCDPAALYPEPPGAPALRAEAEGGRVVLDRGVLTNAGIPLGVPTAGGYCSVVPARRADLLAAAGSPPGRQSFRVWDLPPAWRDALAVRAVVTAPGREPSVPGRLEVVYAGPDLAVWRNPDALPRARVHPTGAVRVVPDQASARAALGAPGFDPRRTVVVEEPSRPAGPPGEPAAPTAAQILADAPGRLRIRAEVPDGGLLVVAEGYSAGWTARTAAGDPLPVRPADLSLLSVGLPPGFAGEVELAYAVPGERAGLAFSALALLLAAALARPTRRRA